MTYRENNASRRAVKGVPSQVVHLFETARVMIDGKPHRGLAIRCGRCRISESVKINSFAVGGGGIDIDKENNLATRRFEKAGWLVGTTASKHRCPVCKPKKEEEVVRNMKSIKDELNGGTSAIAIDAVVPPPKTMSFEDRRIIFEKLNEVYIDEVEGYSEDWTDKKVADHLGVPLAWVAQIREQNFGPHGSNKKIDNTIADAAALVKEMRDTGTRLMNKADDLERRLIDIQQAVRP